MSIHLFRDPRYISIRQNTTRRFRWHIKTSLAFIEYTLRCVGLREYDVARLLNCYINLAEDNLINLLSLDLTHLLLLRDNVQY